MSTVCKAYDPQSDSFRAIKRMKLAQGEELRWKESFNREYSALTELSEHPNVVALHDAGADDDGFYMVLEWIDGNLVDLIETCGAMVWLDFYAKIGKPVLEALAFAQGRGWSHRDIKPQNILMTSNGTPKVADYGIAKKLEKPVIGLTFSSFRSVPFTPPEDDSGDRPGSRDCFSWAGLAIYCLTGKMPTDYGSLAAMAASLDREDIPVDILQATLSHDPIERPPLASALLADIELWSDKQEKLGLVSRVFHLSIDLNTIQHLQRSLDSGDGKDIEKYIFDEISEAVGFRALDPVEGEPRGIRMWAVSWRFDAVLNSTKDRFEIKRASRLSPAEVERRREASFRPALRFAFERPKDVFAAASVLDDFLADLNSFETELQNSTEAAKKERVFRVWYAFLRAKADLESRRENAISYVDYKLNSSVLTLTTELPVSQDLIGQSRLIRLTSGKHIFCDIVDVTLEEVIAVITYGDSTQIPRSGRLEMNSVAAEKAIERQRRALDSVNYDRAASTRLKSLIINPKMGRPSVAGLRSIIGGGPFDVEKTEILSRALGIQDILAIQGPPGTGKTRLIEEILVQYLTRYRRHRVLLSAQTHVALDNVIERLMIRQPDIDIVRIGRIDDPKISNECRDLVLDRKAQAWAATVIAKARAHMASWAEKRGISHADIETGMLVERLILLLQRIKLLRNRLGTAEDGVREVEEQSEGKLAATGSADSPRLDAASVEAEQVAAILRVELTRVKLEVDEVRARLANSGTYGVGLAALSEETELREWSAMLLGRGADQTKCRGLLELQEDWALRVGRSTDFHGAMLASAQVVAGTCIGMAGVRGFGEVVYDLCIVDEASKATATEVLVPMSRSRKWILVGDPKQLPPFFEDDSVTNLEEFEEGEVRETLLDRFLGGLPDHSTAILTNQHRMVKPIGDLISEVFYDGKLNSPKLKPDVTLTGIFRKPVTWLSTTNSSDVQEIRVGQSFRNDAEGRAIRDALEKINFVAQKRKMIYDIALIAGYVAQVKFLQDSIRDRLHEWSGLKVSCSTVDAFQGSEAEICIYSVTRSNRNGRLGFLRERPRLNVALSRGRSSLIIVGDDDFCRSASGDNPFRKVLDFIEANPEQCERRSVE